jgi:3-deoxy-manno-octulosonate cytidylyltransferase (CMP-KDO synthetase)
MKTKFIGIIPARYASTRFPGKPLADLDGKTMIERVYQQVSKALTDVVVATDDARIKSAVEAFGGNVVMTSDKHRSGTDRCFEAYLNVKSSADVVINIQGDEPFIDPSQIESLMSCFENDDVQIATLARNFNPELGIDALTDPNLVKLVMNNNNYAMYFSRHAIPFVRNYNNDDWLNHAKYYTHVGMYGYRASALEKITALQQSTLEINESLEQLRWLQNGYNIKVALTDCLTIGIDTPSDLENARKFLINSKKNAQS